MADPYWTCPSDVYEDERLTHPTPAPQSVRHGLASLVLITDDWELFDPSLLARQWGSTQGEVTDLLGELRARRIVEDVPALGRGGVRFTVCRVVDFYAYAGHPDRVRYPSKRRASALRDAVVRAEKAGLVTPLPTQEATSPEPPSCAGSATEPNPLPAKEEPSPEPPSGSGSGVGDNPLPGQKASRARISSAQLSSAQQSTAPRAPAHPPTRTHAREEPPPALPAESQRAAKQWQEHLRRVAPAVSVDDDTVARVAVEFGPQVFVRGVERHVEDEPRWWQRAPIANLRRRCEWSRDELAKKPPPKPASAPSSGRREFIPEQYAVTWMGDNVHLERYIAGERDPELVKACDASKCAVQLPGQPVFGKLFRDLEQEHRETLFAQFSAFRAQAYS